MLEELTPAERYVIFQQTGVLTSSHAKLVDHLVRTGHLPQSKEELEEIAAAVTAAEQGLIRGDGGDGEDLGEQTLSEEQLQKLLEREGALDPERASVEDEEHDRLPSVKVGRELQRAQTLEKIFANADQEAAEFLVTSRCSRLWEHAFRAGREDAVVREVLEVRQHGGSYWNRVTDSFLSDYHRARGLELPNGYAFIDPATGNPGEPNLMQRLIAVRLRDEHRRGNWSGTGAGKTLSAVLASRVSEAQMTLITCPNNVVDTWKDGILNAFPDSEVVIRTFQPNWLTDAPRYLVLNYEAFQQSKSPSHVQALLERERLDMVVVDELHFVKQRSAENLSRRKQVIEGLLSLAAGANPALRVLGMSATPVINNLQEGKSLIELITGIGHDDLQTRATLGNCVRMFQQLSRLGLRWKPDYGISIREHFRAEDGMIVDCPQETIEAIGGCPPLPARSPSSSC